MCEIIDNSVFISSNLSTLSNTCRSESLLNSSCLAINQENIIPSDLILELISIRENDFLDVNNVSKIIDSWTLFDCRPMNEHNKSHIKNSVHINCRDKITLNRLSSKKLQVKNIVSNEAVKRKFENFDSNDVTGIILYDEATTYDYELESNKNPLKIVLENIKYTHKNFHCKILKGGFKKFSEIYPNLCESKNLKINFDLTVTSKYFDIESKLKYEMNNAKLTKINEYLYLGNECDAQNEEILEKEGIKYIINVTKNIPLHHENKNKNFKYLRIAVNDACNQNLKQHFNETNKFIDEARKNNGKVLVHCQAGISRSPTVVIAYLMKTYELTVNDAHNEVRNKRIFIAPNIIFMSQLMDYENYLMNETNCQLL